MLDLNKTLDAYIKQSRADANEERAERYGSGRDAFYVSEAGYCQRKVAYEFFGLKRGEMEARNIRIFHNGEYLQKRYSDYLKAMGIWVAEEVPVHTRDRNDVPFIIAGRVDIIINYKKLMNPSDETPLDKLEDEDLAILEVKSINQWGFKEVSEGVPKDEHLFQLTLYMWLTGIHKGYIVYECKDDQQMVCIPVAYDPRLVYGIENHSKGLLMEFTELAQMIENRVVPPRCRDASTSRFPCKWRTGQCDFYDYCYDPEHSGERVPEPEVEILEIQGVQITPDNMPEGWTLEDFRRMKALLETIPAVSAKDNADEEPATPVDKPSVAYEYATEDGNRAFKCVSCEREVTFSRLGKGGNVICNHCDKTNPVRKGE